MRLRRTTVRSTAGGAPSARRSGRPGWNGFRISGSSLFHRILRPQGSGTSRRMPRLFCACAPFGTTRRRRPRGPSRLLLPSASRLPRRIHDLGRDARLPRRTAPSQGLETFTNRKAIGSKHRVETAARAECGSKRDKTPAKCYESGQLVSEPPL